MKEYIYNVLPAARIAGKHFSGFWYTSKEKLHTGDLVQIPLSGRKTLGVVLSEIRETPHQPLKEISELLLPQFFTEERRRLLDWFVSYYHAPAGLVLHLFLTGYSKVTRKVRKKIEDQTHFTEKKDIKLNKEQEKAVLEIVKSVEDQQNVSFLLFGPTGSGKTEVYLEVCKKIHSRKKQSVILVPEIALTPQTLSRFSAHFKNDVFVYHSKMTPAQKRLVMEAAYQKENAIIVGPRSALFLPYQNLGVIIFDDEHDTSFQQMDQNPHFNSRLVARKYAEFLKIPIIFGDATPEIELYHETQQKMPSMKLLELHKRISGSSQNIPLPEVTIVDLVQEIRRGNRSPFSQKLFNEITQTLQDKEQVFLFINRRGLASSVVCLSCSNVILCKNCSSALVLHGDVLLCHHCGYRMVMPATCPSCKKPTLKTRGIGTERIAQEISRFFPKARTIQVDTDTIKTRAQYHAMYEKIKNHEVDIVIGTQMIAQGLDIPNVKLVGVIQCDNALNLPDFHSEEHVFQLLTQVAGRAGRVQKQGKVIIQTFFPLHPVFESVKSHDYRLFYSREIIQRKDMEFPPFSHYVACIYQHKDPKIAEEQANFLTQILSQSSDIEIFGPSPAFITKRRNVFRWQVLIRTKRLDIVPFDIIPNTWDIYVDPQSLLL